MRQTNFEEVEKGIFRRGVTATIDGTYSKLLFKHYYDFTHHFVEILDLVAFLEFNSR